MIVYIKSLVNIVVSGFGLGQNQNILRLKKFRQETHRAEKDFIKEVHYGL